MPSANDSAISPPLQMLLDLFATELSEVKFPDLDAAALEAAADRVRVHAEALANAETAVATAQAMLNESQEALLSKGQRALAYLRVYAEENLELATKLDAVNLPRPARKLNRMGADLSPISAAPVEAPKKRGRPAKSAVNGSDPLFAGEAEETSALPAERRN